jgi:AraC-like DNA-binding protein
MKSFYETQADLNDYTFIHDFSETDIGAHFHKSIELVYCLNGKTEFFINGKKYLLDEDEIYFVPSYAVHSNKCLQSNKIISLVFAHNFFHDFEKTYPNMTFDNVLRNKLQNKNVLYPLFKEFYETYWDYWREPIPFLKRQSLINDLLFRMALIYPLVPIQQKKVDSTILEILTFIHQHYTEDLNLNSLAERYHYCPQYFSELFNKNVGCSLNAYLNNIRIEGALTEIDDPNNKKTLTQIAFDYGFKSLPTFYRTLREKRKN